MIHATDARTVHINSASRQYVGILVVVGSSLLLLISGESLGQSIYQSIKNILLLKQQGVVNGFYTIIQNNKSSKGTR